MAEDVSIFSELPACKKPRLDTETQLTDKDILSSYNFKNPDISNGTSTVTDEPKSSNTEENADNSFGTGMTWNEANREEFGDIAGPDDSDNMSDISNLSGISEDAWQCHSGSMVLLQRQMMSGANPREILQDLIPSDVLIPNDVDDFTLWKIIVNIMSEPPRRQKLTHVNKIDDVLHLLTTCKRIMVLTGAGVSVSCGIPDFRSRNGIYARLAVDFPDLPDPQAMFSIRYFTNDPRPFFKFAMEIYPGQFEPSKSHKFIKLLEDRDKLLRNYTQNIDTLEQVAGIKNVIQCHGSFATATCMVCKYKVDAEQVKADIFNQVIPHCPKCPAEDMLAVMKPDIVFFGESLPEEFHKQMAADKDCCDLLIVIGSSLKVRPVALIPNSLPPDIPQILINREPLQHMTFDVELLGNCDSIVTELCKRLHWDGLDNLNLPLMEEVTRDQLTTPPPILPDCSAATDRFVDDFVSTTTDNTEFEDVQNSSKKSDKTNSIEDQVSPKRNSSVTNNVEMDVSTCVREIDNCTSPNEEHAAVDSEEAPCQDLEQSGDKTEGKDSEQQQPSSSVESSTVEDRTFTENKVTTLSYQAQGNEGETEGKAGDISQEESDLELMRSMWQPRRRESLSQRLEDHQFLYLPPCRYVFPGAEVYYGTEEDSDDDPSSDISSTCSSVLGPDDEEIAKTGETRTDELTGSCEKLSEKKNSGEVIEGSGFPIQSTEVSMNCKENISSGSSDLSVTDNKHDQVNNLPEQENCIREPELNTLSGV